MCVFEISDWLSPNAYILSDFIIQELMSEKYISNK